MRIRWTVVGSTLVGGFALLVWAAVYQSDHEYFIVVRQWRVEGSYLVSVLTSLGSALLLIPVLEAASTFIVRQVVRAVRTVEAGDLVGDVLERALLTLGDELRAIGWSQVTDREHRGTESLCFASDERHIGISWSDRTLRIHDDCAVARSDGELIGTVSSFTALATDADLRVVEQLRMKVAKLTSD